MDLFSERIQKKHLHLLFINYLQIAILEYGDLFVKLPWIYARFAIFQPKILRIIIFQKLADFSTIGIDFLKIVC